MNMLAALFAGAALLAGAVLAGYRMRTRGPAAAGKSVFLAGFAGVLLVSSLGVYATLGRWSDWDKAEVDHDVDYLLAAKLTDARPSGPNDPRQRIRSASSSHWSRSKWAGTRMQSRRLTAASASREKLPSCWASRSSPSTIATAGSSPPRRRAAVGRVFDMNPLEVRTRMLLGQDAFLNGRYAEAVGHWRMLLDAGAAPDKERALKTAIAKAEARMTR